MWCVGWREGGVRAREGAGPARKGEEEAEGRHSLSHRARAMSGARSLVFCLRYDATASLVTAVTARGWFEEETDRRPGGAAGGGGGPTTEGRGRGAESCAARMREVAGGRNSAGYRVRITELRYT